MGYPMKTELTRVGLPVYLANHYTTLGARLTYVYPDELVLLCLSGWIGSLMFIQKDWFPYIYPNELAHLRIPGWIYSLTYTRMCWFFYVYPDGLVLLRIPGFIGSLTYTRMD